MVSFGIIGCICFTPLVIFISLMEIVMTPVSSFLNKKEVDTKKPKNTGSMDIVFRSIPVVGGREKILVHNRSSLIGLNLTA